jgi:lactate permease
VFNQILDPTGYLALTWLVALAPVALLLVLLAVFRMSAWLATLIGSLVTLLLAVWIWKMPFGDGMRAYLYGSATGVWSVDWITIWGVVLFNSLVVTGVFRNFAAGCSLKGQPTCGSKHCFLPGPSARFLKG